MHPQQRSLALLNVVGGIAVLGSYALAFAYAPEVRTGLWGNVPDALRPVYQASMLLAAAGYFPFTYQLVIATRPRDFTAATRIPYKGLHLVYGMILVPSATWLPLTGEMLQAPSAPLWSLIRLALALVALGSTTLLGLLAVFAARRGGTLAWASVAGGAAFWFQTAILDAVVWPAYFPA